MTLWRYKNKSFISGEEVLPELYREGELFGSPILEYGDPNYPDDFGHILIWFFNSQTSGSLPFHMQHIQWSGEGVVNMIRLFDIQNQAGRFGLLFHFGFQAVNAASLNHAHKFWEP